MTHFGPTLDDPARGEAALCAAGGIAPALIDLLRAFEVGGLSYCYWKSTRRLEAALSGASDLDLLVSRQHRDRAAQTLREAGFKPFADAAWRSDAGATSFLGHDEATGIILHVHLHVWILVGDALFKQLRLPFEDRFLARSGRHPTFPVRVLDPVDEAALLAVRACFELRFADLAKAHRLPALRQKFQLDLRFLRTAVDPGQFYERASALFGDIVASDLAAWFAAGELPRSPAKIRGALLRRFAAHRACGPLRGFALHGTRVLAHALAEANRRLWRLPLMPRRRRFGGGLIVAIVGVDGSGKSTLCAELCAWLETELDARPIYFGTGDGKASLVLRPFKMMVPIASRFMKTKPRGASHGAISTRAPGLVHALLFTIWATVVALEKRQKLVMARRAARRGFIIVTDRWPQTEVEGFNDGPLLPRLDRAPAALRRFERRAYEAAQRAAPDLLIKLHADAETVAGREPDMNRSVIADRLQAFVSMSFGADQIVSLRTELGREEVARRARRALWAAI